MSHDVIIRAENLSKLYQLGASVEMFGNFRETLMTLPGTLIRRGRNGANGRNANLEARELWALRDVSFEIQRGEVVGVIGRNGAGKSTLLKILSQITAPTEGKVDIYGRLSSLLEVGTGFHPELTGRENIYLNGSILGMRKVEIDRNFDEIVAFAEVEKFLDTPVKRYSSGMYVRLAFAVAAHLNPEVLVVDEVLAVGDASFQQKCLGKMSEVARGGRTILFVSHNMAAIQSLCNKAIYLRSGQIVSQGDTAGILETYMSDQMATSTIKLADRTDRRGTGDLRLIDFIVENQSSDKTSYVYPGASLRMTIQYECKRSVSDVHFVIGIYNQFGERLLSLNSAACGKDYERIESDGAIQCAVERWPLPAGNYRINISANSRNLEIDRVEDAYRMVVEHGDFYRSGRAQPVSAARFLLDCDWS